MIPILGTPEMKDVPDVEGGEAELKPLTIWKPSQFLQYVEPANNHLVLPAYLSKGSITSMIGQGGLGKSRLALWLAVSQITGKPWCGLETGGDPQRWLFLGDE